MTGFTEKELEFIKSQRLARLATISKSGIPDVAAVGYYFDGRYFWIGHPGGIRMTKTMKYWNVKANPQVALIIDELISYNQTWKARGIKIHGTATIESSAEMDKIFQDALKRPNLDYKMPGRQIRIDPELKWAWQVEGEGESSAKVRVK